MDRDKPHERYSWRETRRMIAEGELPGDLPCISLVLSPLEGCLVSRERKFWFQYVESKASHTPHFSQFLPVFLFPLYFSLCPRLACLYLLEGCMLHVIEGTQLHRCVAWLAVFSICLEQPPLQDHRPWWRAVEAPFGSFSFDMGLLSPDIPPSPSPLSSWVLLWNKESCQEGESIIALARGATFNVSTQMEKRAQHNKSTVM